jgi:hypothetical protein
MALHQPTPLQSLGLERGCLSRLAIDQSHQSGSRVIDPVHFLPRDGKLQKRGSVKLLTVPVLGRAVTALPVRRHDDRVRTLLMSGPRVRGHTLPEASRKPQPTLTAS